MSDRRTYEAELLGEVVQLFSPRQIPSHVHVGLSDEAVANEHRSAKIVYDAVAQFRAEIMRARELTDLRADALDDLLAAVADETPSAVCWEEDIGKAKRGY